LHRVEDPTTVQPVKKPSMTDLLNSWEPLSDEDALPEIEDFPPEPVDL
jgi:antitoxin VapB